MEPIYLLLCNLLLCRDMLGKLSGQREDDGRYADFDGKLKKLDTQLREGCALQPGSSKVSGLADDYTTVLQVNRSPPPVSSKASSDLNPWTPELASKTDQTCFFCQKRVYLAERKSLEGLFFHRVCFRCHYCGKLLQVCVAMFSIGHWREMFTISYFYWTCVISHVFH